MVRTKLRLNSHKMTRKLNQLNFCVVHSFEKTLIRYLALCLVPEVCIRSMGAIALPYSSSTGCTFPFQSCERNSSIPKTSMPSSVRKDAAQLHTSIFRADVNSSAKIRRPLKSALSGNSVPFTSMATTFVPFCKMKSTS